MFNLKYLASMGVEDSLVELYLERLKHIAEYGDDAPIGGWACVTRHVPGVVSVRSRR